MQGSMFKNIRKITFATSLPLKFYMLSKLWLIMAEFKASEIASYNQHEMLGKHCRGERIDNLKCCFACLTTTATEIIVKNVESLWLIPITGEGFSWNTELTAKEIKIKPSQSHHDTTFSTKLKYPQSRICLGKSVIYSCSTSLPLQFNKLIFTNSFSLGSFIAKFVNLWKTPP